MSKRIWLAIGIVGISLLFGHSRGLTGEFSHKIVLWNIVALYAVVYLRHTVYCWRHDQLHDRPFHDVGGLIKPRPLEKDELAARLSEGGTLE
jgi:hypothetical protein